MAWSNSKVFREWIIGPALQSSGTSYTGLDGDTVKAALFNNSVVPDQDAAVGSTGFNTGTWLTANEVTDATNWVSGGRTVGTKTFTAPAAATVRFDAADTSGGGNVTISNAFGCLVYDDTITGGTVADQGVCFNYFGAGQSVTNGTFTIVWHANGIVQFAL
jgi:hypothetical protein